MTQVAARDKLEQLGQNIALGTPEMHEHSINTALSATKLQLGGNPGGSGRKRKRKGWSSLKDLIASRCEISPPSSRSSLIPTSQVPLSCSSELLETLHSKSIPDIPMLTGNNSFHIGSIPLKARVMDAESSLHITRAGLDMKDERINMRIGHDIQGELDVKNGGSKIVFDVDINDERDKDRETMKRSSENNDHSQTDQEEPPCGVQTEPGHWISTKVNPPCNNTVLVSTSFESKSQRYTTAADIITKNVGARGQMSNMEEECIAKVHPEHVSGGRQGIELVLSVAAIEDAVGQSEGDRVHRVQFINKDHCADVKASPMDDAAALQIPKAHDLGIGQSNSGLVSLNGLVHERLHDGKLGTSEAGLQGCILSNDTDGHTGLQTHDILQESSGVDKGLMESLLFELESLRRAVKGAGKLKDANGYPTDLSPRQKLLILSTLQAEIQYLSEQIEVLKTVVDQTSRKVSEAFFQSNKVISTEIAENLIPTSPEAVPEEKFSSESLATNQQPLEAILECELQGRVIERKEHVNDPTCYQHSGEIGRGLHLKKKRCQRKCFLTDVYHNPANLDQALQKSLNDYGSSDTLETAYEQDRNCTDLNGQSLLSQSDASKLGLICRIPGQLNMNSRRRLSVEAAKPCRRKAPMLQKIGRRWFAAGKKGQMSSYWKRMI